MQMSKIVLSALVAMSAFGGLYAAPTHQGKKIYVDSSSVSVAKDGILAQTKDGPIHVKVLRSDDQGIFIYENEVSELVSKGEVYCLKCKYWMSRQAYFSHLPCRGRR